jgi:hypothetical protein
MDPGSFKIQFPTISCMQICLLIIFELAWLYLTNVRNRIVARDVMQFHHWRAHDEDHSALFSLGFPILSKLQQRIVPQRQRVVALAPLEIALVIVVVECNMEVIRLQPLLGCAHKLK